MCGGGATCVGLRAVCVRAQDESLPNSAAAWRWRAGAVPASGRRHRVAASSAVTAAAASETRPFWQRGLEKRVLCGLGEQHAYTRRLPQASDEQEQCERRYMVIRLLHRRRSSELGLTPFSIGGSSSRCRTDLQMPLFKSQGRCIDGGCEGGGKEGTGRVGVRVGRTGAGSPGSYRE